jgi:lipid II:glycine glycyltransferase (peptidoglycan interpeptide bridge formation enzyme)
MVKWEIDRENCAAGWDHLLLQSSDYNVFQSFGWGEYKRTAGWTPLRCIARNGRGTPVAMVQILTKGLPLGAAEIGWAPGGPVCFFPGSKNEELPEVLKGLVESVRPTKRRFLVRFNSMVPFDSVLASSFRSLLRRPIFFINSGHSIQFDMTRPTDDIERQMTSKHRYYVKKAMKEHMEWKSGNEAFLVRDLVSLHKEMASTKKDGVTAVDMDDISELCKVLHGQVTILTGYVDNAPVCSCLVLLFGEKASYSIAASGDKGRKVGAAYAMIPQLIEHLKRIGIKEMDLGGTNPTAPSARGVDHFKKGFGGKPVEYLGEWEWSGAGWLRWGVNLAIRYKLGLR